MRNIAKTAIKTSRLIAPLLVGRFASLPLKPTMARLNLTNTPRFFFSGKSHENIIKGSYEGPGFYMEQLLTGCLSLYSYYIESGSQAFLIDPMNETEKYDEILKQRGKTLKGVFLTHYHADFIAGHMEIQKKYKCQVYMGPTALENFNVKVLQDAQKINIGSIALKLLHTPGHTEESSVLVLSDSNGKDQCVFTGDTLFLNEVGRPDLAVKTHRTAEDLGNMLFESLEKLKRQIPKDVRIYPGHGAGSSCGKNIGKGDFCTMGTQMENNYALKQNDKQQFVKKVLQDMPKAPQYFSHDAGINKYSPFDYDSIQQVVMNKLSSSDLKNLMKKDAARVIDVRIVKEIEAEGFIKGAINIDFGGNFASWVGTLFSPKGFYIVYGRQDKAKQTIKRLLRIGYTNIGGYCSDDIKTLSQNLQIYQNGLAPSVLHENRTVIDVRKPTEWSNGIVADAQVITFQLSKLFQSHQNLDKSKKYVVHCAGGFRARIAMTFLKNQGYDVKVWAHGGAADFQKHGIKTKIPK